MAPMSTLDWASLLVLLMAAAGGIVFAGLRALAAWRAFRRLQRRAGDALLETTRKLAQAEQRLAGAADAAARLDQARLRLEETFATAAILAAAAGEARAAVGRLGGVVPLK
jgi:hypothetical protein